MATKTTKATNVSSSALRPVITLCNQAIRYHNKKQVVTVNVDNSMQLNNFNT